MANLSNINNKFLVTTGGNILIGQTAAVGSSILQVTGNSTFGGNVGIVLTNTNSVKLGITGNSGLPATSGTTQTGLLRLKASNNATLDMGADHINAVGWLQVTDVVNLSLEYNLLLQPNGGNVGIGIDSPDTILNLNKTGGAIIRLQSGVTNTADGLYGGIEWYNTDPTTDGPEVVSNIMSYQNDANGRGGYITFGTTNGFDGVGSPTERMRIDSLGNIGVGVTPESWGTNGDTRAIQISTMTSLSEAFDGTQLASNFYFDGTNDKYIQSDFATSYLQIDGTHRWRYAASGTADANITWSEAMRIDSSGDVGIGVTDGDIFGRFYGRSVGIGGAAICKLQLDGTSYSGIDLGKGGTRYGEINASDTGLDLYALGSTTLKMFTNGSPRMRITSGGEVGIGTNFVSAKLQVHSTNAGQPTVPLFIVNESTTVGTEARLGFAANTNNDVGTNRYSYISTINTSGSNGQDMVFATNETGASAVERMRIDSSGNVGIGGSANDGYRLQVVGTSQDSTTISMTYVGVGAGALKMTSNGAMAFGVDAADGATERMRITSGGDVLVNSATAFSIATHDPNVITTESFGINNGSNTSTFGLDRIHFDSSNYYVLNAAAVGVKLVNGATAWTAQSDESLKENIKPLENVLDKIKDYRCVEYNLKANNNKKIGFIAQDWENDFAPIVNKDDEGLLGMKYTETIPVLLKAIQELKAEVDSLKQKCNCKN